MTDLQTLISKCRNISLPRVSVIIVCSNKEKMLKRALDSVAAQTFSLFNCTIVDDGSSDETAKVARRWIEKKSDDRYRFIRNNRTLGLLESLKVALAAAESEFVAILDADDVWFPEFLTRHIELHLNRLYFAGVSVSSLIERDDEPSSSRSLGSHRGAVQGALFETPPDIDLIYSGTAIEASVVFPDFRTWYRGARSAAVYRRPLLMLVIPAEAKNTEPLSTAFLATFAHFLTGSLVIRSALGERPSDRSARSLENGCRSYEYEGDVQESAKAAKESLRRAILQHALDSFEALATVFWAPVIFGRTKNLYRDVLRTDNDFSHPELTNVFGFDRVLNYRVRASIRHLRRKLFANDL